MEKEEDVSLLKALSGVGNAKRPADEEEIKSIVAGAADCESLAGSEMLLAAGGPDSDAGVDVMLRLAPIVLVAVAVCVMDGKDAGTGLTVLTVSWTPSMVEDETASAGRVVGITGDAE